MCKGFSEKLNFTHMLSLTLSIQRDEIHGNMLKCGKTYSKFTKSFRYDQTNIQLRAFWIFDLIVWTTAIVDTRNVNYNWNKKLIVIIGHLHDDVILLL